MMKVAVQTRKNFIALMDELTIDALNTVSPGFRNNIAWNFGHIVASQQVLCYERGGLVPRVPVALLDKYRKGTKPEGFISQEEIDHLKELSFSLLDQFTDDLENNYFEHYQPCATHFGVTLENIADATLFFQCHDNMHLGYAMAIRRALEGRNLS